MTEPSSERTGSGTDGGAATAADSSPETAPATDFTENRYADLDRRPVAEHVDVFEDVHGRLQRELGTIDQL
jgi:hypothetical protein